MNDVVIDVRVTSIRSRGKHGGAIFSGVTDGGDQYVAVCDYVLIPDSIVVVKGQMWHVEGTVQRSSYQTNGFWKTEEQVFAKVAELLAPSGSNLVSWIANSDECVGIGPVKAARLYRHFGDSLVTHIEQRNVGLLMK